MRAFITGIYLSLSTCLLAQPNLPNPGWIYSDSTIPRIDIWINADSLAAIYAPGNEESDHEFPAQFVFTRDGQSDTIDLVGFRLRGNTSRYSAKKSFKVSINSFVDGQKFHGVEKLNLNGEHNDPAIIRSKLCWDLERAMDIPAPRSNHVAVYINGKYYGLYINVEHIDDEFVQSRFGTDAGNLYKCLYPADLAYINNNPESYKQLTSGGRSVYELKTNENVANFSGLAHFIDVLNNTPSTDFECALEDVLDVDAFLRALAVEIYTGQWDNVINNKNNYYLYENPLTGRIEYISYDMDNTYGVDWFGIDWAKRNIYHWDNLSDPSTIYNRILGVPKFRDQFTAYFKEVLQLTDTSIYFPDINRLRDNAQPWAAIDSFYRLDYGYTPVDFINSYNQTIGAHVKYGIKPYIKTRNDSAWAQLENANAVPSFQWVVPKFSGLADSFRVRARVWDEMTPSIATLFYRINGGSWDSVAGQIRTEDIYWAVPPLQTLATMDWYVVVSDQIGQDGRYPCQNFETLDFSKTPDIRINEFMADNDQIVQDEAGDHDDWFELYNAGSTDVSMAGLTLTDDFGDPGQWPMPDTVLPAGKWLLIWADDEGSQGPLHANFKLGKGGEQIGLFMITGSGYLPVDTLSFGQQVTDSSQGCYPDGVRPIVKLDPATPGASNVITGISNVPEQPTIHIWPNPARDQIWIELGNWGARKVQIQLMDATGRVVLDQISSGESELRVNLPSKLASGLWLLRIDSFTVAQQIEKRVTWKLIIE